MSFYYTQSHRYNKLIIPTLLNLTILFCPIKPQIKNVNCLNDFSSFPEYNFEFNLCQIPLTGPRHPWRRSLPSRNRSWKTSWRRRSRAATTTSILKTMTIGNLKSKLKPAHFRRSRKPAKIKFPPRRKRWWLQNLYSKFNRWAFKVFIKK